MLSKILGNWLNKSSNNDEEAKVSNLPKYKQAWLMLDVIEARKNNPFNPIKAGAIPLQAIDSNVLALITRIDQYSEKLELGEGLTPKDCFAEVKEVSLDHFFTDDEENYIPLHVVDDFIKSSRRLISYIDRATERNDRGIEYSVRLLGKCIASIQSVCKAMESAAT